MNLKELSQELGMSKTTVSRALNGYPEVSERTRQRVTLAARSKGYRPNPTACRLATGKTKTVGHVLSIPTKDRLVNPLLGEFLAGACEVYSHHGYDLKLVSSARLTETRIYRDLKESCSVDGVVVDMPLIVDNRIKYLNELGLPFVVHGRSSGITANYSRVEYDNLGAFQKATAHLLQLGHRRIGLVNGQELKDFAVQRRKGYEKALNTFGIEPDDLLVRSDHMTEPFGLAAAFDMLHLDNPPTGFVVSSVVSALGVRRAVIELGMKVGTDVSIVTQDDTISYFSNSGSVPMFTAVRYSQFDAGRRCAEMLLKLIARPGDGPFHEFRRPEFVLGLSSGPKPPRLSLGSNQCRVARTEQR